MREGGEEEEVSMVGLQFCAPPLPSLIAQKRQTLGNISTSRWRISQPGSDAHNILITKIRQFETFSATIDALSRGPRRGGTSTFFSFWNLAFLSRHHWGRRGGIKLRTLLLKHHLTSRLSMVPRGLSWAPELGSPIMPRDTVRSQKLSRPFSGHKLLTRHYV